MHSAMHNNAKIHLKKAGYDSDEDISNMPESERKAYAIKMRNSVKPAKLLYDDSGASIDYESFSSDSESEYDPSSKTVWLHSRSFTTVKHLFINLMHEGSHAWDHAQGLYAVWRTVGGETYRKAATEVRAYNMERWFGGSIRNQSYYSTYLNQANSMFLT